MLSSKICHKEVYVSSQGTSHGNYLEGHIYIYLYIFVAAIIIIANKLISSNVVVFVTLITNILISSAIKNVAKYFPNDFVKTVHFVILTETIANNSYIILTCLAASFVYILY